MQTPTANHPAALWLFLASIVFSQALYAGPKLAVGDQAPDWILANQAHENISYYHDSADQKTVLLFWATWCPYCAALMPELEKLRAELDDPNIKFYALNIWEDSDPQSYMEKSGFGFTLILDADNVAKRYGVSGTPGLFVVDADKKILYVREKGGDPEDVTAAVKQALTTAE